MSTIKGVFIWLEPFLNTWRYTAHLYTWRSGSTNTMELWPWNDSMVASRKERKKKPSVSYKWTFSAWKVQINARTTAKDLVKTLERTSTNTSKSTVKTVLYGFNIKRPLGKEEATAPKPPGNRRERGLQLHLVQRLYFMEKCSIKTVI